MAFKYNYLFEIAYQNAREYPDRESHRFRKEDSFGTSTFKVFFEDINYLAAAFERSKISSDTHVALFSDNRYEWTVTDFALQLLGAVSVPRGSDTTPKELGFILEHSDSTVIIVENLSTLESLFVEQEEYIKEKIHAIFVMDQVEHLSRWAKDHKLRIKINNYAELLKMGHSKIWNINNYYHKKIAELEEDPLVSIIYTSGTSGNPKGVILSQSNFLHNVRALTPLLQADPDAGETTVSMLPIWHVYERTFEYCSFASGMRIVYSNIKTFTEDLKQEKPHLVASVPRVWESVFNRIMDGLKKESGFKQFLFKFFLSQSKAYLYASNAQKGLYLSKLKKPRWVASLAHIWNRVVMFLTLPGYKISRRIFKPLTAIFGGHLRGSFSGGGSLPHHVDEFFNAIGVTLINAYGMTETAPGLITRGFDHNTIGVTGIPLDETEVKLLTKDGRPARVGEKGILYVRGPQVMRGYYKNPQETAKVLDSEGWLNTGDVAIQTENGDIMITGRAKSTIVLIGGENVEPEPIEEKIKECMYVEHVVLFGQDKKGLTALISIDENQLKDIAKKMKVSVEELLDKSSDVITHNKVVQFVQKEISKLVNKDTGFKPSERVKDVVLTTKKFKVGEELTQTLKVKRNVVAEKYKDLIDEKPDKAKTKKQNKGHK